MRDDEALEPSAQAPAPSRRELGSFAASEPTSHERFGKLAVPTFQGLHYVPFADIIRLEGSGAYCTLYTTIDPPRLFSKGLGAMERMLPSGLFFRCHNSHVVNLRRITELIRIDGHKARLDDGSVVYVSRRKWVALIHAMQNLT